MTASSVSVRPFELRVDDLEVPTLLCVSSTCGVPLSDLRQWNQRNPVVAAAGVDDELPFGTIVQLPPLAFVRHPSFGETFVLGDMLQRIASAEKSLEALRSRELQRNEETPLFRPKRRIAPLAAHFVDSVRRESAAQLARIHAEFPSVDPVQKYGKGWKELLVEEVVDATPVTQRLQQEHQDIIASQLVSLQPENVACMSQLPIRQAPNVVTELKEHTTRDHSASQNEEWSCPFHQRAIEVSFFQPGRAVAHKETWEVLGCQTLAALVDAVECMNELLPYPKTRDSFMFIAGTFYVDDRHEGYQDLSSLIRNVGTAQATTSASGSVHASLLDGSNPAYGVCPVKSLTTRIADISVKMHEMCVYRHMGSCDHYFFFKDLSSPMAVPRPRSLFPRRTYLSRSHVTLCDLCNALPSTIITYGDILAPKNPTFYCPPCYRIFHVNESGQDMRDGYIKFELPPEQHF